MAKQYIYSKDGSSIKYVGYPRYNGNYLKVSYLEFASISSPKKINWEVGDYVDYSRTGLRYRLYNLPQNKKQARRGESGEAFLYTNVQFCAKTKDLEIAFFRDYVIDDNKIHFSTNSGVSTYENAYGIVNRIQACLDQEFPGEWVVKVYDDLDEDFIEKITESMDFSVNGTVMDACNQIYELWGLGWIHTIEGGKDTLIFGRPNKRSSENTTSKFLYGKNNGLTAITKSIANADEIATRLYVYGSTRNMLSGYYNNLDIKDAESVDIQHLMLPLRTWGKTDGLPDASKAFIEDASAVAKLGRIPKIVYFDGTEDYPEIYPSLEGVKIEDIWGVLSPSDTYYPKVSVWSGKERVDKIFSAVPVTDSGKEGGNNGTKYLDSKTIAFSMAPTTYKGTSQIKFNVNVFSGLVLGAGEIVKSQNVLHLDFENADGRIGNIEVKANIKDSTKNVTIVEMTRQVTANKWTYDLSQWAFTRGEGPLSMSLEITVIPNTTNECQFTVSAPTTNITIGTTNEIGNTFVVYVPQLGFDPNLMAALSSEGKCSIAMKSGMCAARQFTVQSAVYHNDNDTWEFICDRVYDQDIAEWFPNKTYQIEAGDEYVLLDIAMPDLYVTLAMERLLKKGQELYNSISRAKPFYEPEIDAKKMAESGAVLTEGMYMYLQDDDLIENVDATDFVLIDTLTIAEGESVIPTYKVTLREQKAYSFKQTTQQQINNLENKVAIVANTNTAYANRAGSASYASKAGDADTWSGHRFPDMMDQSVRRGDDVEFQKMLAKSLVTELIKSPSFATGLLGNGFQIGRDDNGNYTLEIDNMIVRKAMKVFELIIQQIKHQGGIMFYSAASMECSKVEETALGYKCYFDTKDGQVPNEFEIDDQARCQRFDLATTTAKYYWRKVIEVGDDYIVLSKTDCDTGSDIPEVGDNIVQCGNRTGLQRQAVKITYAMGDSTPRDEYYKGINDYNLENKLITVVGVKDGEIGVFTKNGKFEGEVVIGSGSTGLTNLSEWAEQSQRISNAWNEALSAMEKAENAQKTADEAIDKIDSLLDLINNDKVLDLDEKNIIRTEWTNINGIESTTRESTKGSYYSTRRSFVNLSFEGTDSVFTYKGVTYTYNERKLVYRVTGLSRLDAAYLQLRDYLNEIELNNKTEVFSNFNREKFADLLTAYYDAEDSIKDLTNTCLNGKIDSTKDELNATIQNFQTAVNSAISDLQDQIDDAITTWYMEGEPTLGNLPASQWTAEEMKSHIGDLYYDKLTGYAYRFLLDGSTYTWAHISDEGIAKALADAAKAQDTADSKRRVFYRQPLDSEAYDPGDIWVNATYAGKYDNDILRCNKAKAADVAFSIADWELASKYTDDTVANKALQDAAKAQDAADAAQGAADAAQTTANGALATANALTLKLQSWASDNIISPVEKQALKQQFEDVKAEKEQILSEAAEYKDWIVDYDNVVNAYLSAFNAAVNAFVKYTDDSTEEIAVEADFANIAAYYTARVTIADTIAQAAKKRADEAANDAKDAWDLANTANGNAEAAAKAADAAQKAADEAKTAADAAQTTANGAAQSAANANAKLSDWASDSLISPVEKEALRQQWKDVQTEYAQMCADAAQYATWISGYTSKLALYQDAYNLANVAFEKYTKLIPAEIVVEADYKNIAAYYDARTIFANTIAEAAKLRADAAAEDAADAWELANKAQGFLDELNDDNIFDVFEKDNVRREWVAINGIESTTSGSNSGSYYNTLRSIAPYTKDVVFSFAGKVLTYNSVALNYNNVGSSTLTAAYLELRDYLNGVELNTKSSFRGFRRPVLENLLKNYYDAEDKCRELISSALDNKIDQTRTDLLLQLSNFQSAVNTAISDLQGQIDDAITTWYYDGEPTMKNLPASEWTTEEERKAHIGDLYYDKKTGYAYRFLVDEGVYGWQRIADEGIAKALEEAAKAQDTADSKRRVFYRQPLDSEAYEPGDLWVNATYGALYSDDLLVCKTAKDAGVVFNIADWQLSSKYTDDTVANQAKQDAANAQKKAEEAATAADAAKTTADAAAKSAADANNKLTDWASDNYISPVEKEALRQQYKDVKTEKDDIVANALQYQTWIDNYTASVNAFITAFNNAVTAFEKYTAETPDMIPIVADYANIAAYYDARTLILDIVAKAAKKRADEAASDAASAWDLANQADEKAQSAKDTAEAVRDALNEINDDNILDTIEKDSLRIEWVAINGIESTTTEGNSGSYFTTLQHLVENAPQNAVTLSYGGVVFTYKGIAYSYRESGSNALKSAYLELREYLNEVELNVRGRNYYNFDRAKLSELLKNYYDAENKARALVVDDSRKTNDTIRKVLDEFASDNYISPTEKRTFVTVLDDEKQAYSQLIATAGIYSGSTTSEEIAVRTAATAYTTAYNKFKATIEYYTAIATWEDSIAITASHPLADITDYYDKRSKLVEAIDAAIKAYTDKKVDAGSTAAMDALAQQLGYGNYENMVKTVSELGQTLIVGGLINTQLINVATLIAKRLNTNPDEGIDNILIEDNYIAIRNSDGLVKALFHSNPLGSTLSSVTKTIAASSVDHYRYDDLTSPVDVDAQSSKERIWAKEISLHNITNKKMLLLIPDLLITNYITYEGNPYDGDYQSVLSADIVVGDKTLTTKPTDTVWQYAECYTISNFDVSDSALTTTQILDGITRYMPNVSRTEAAELVNGGEKIFNESADRLSLFEDWCYNNHIFFSKSKYYERVIKHYQTYPIYSGNSKNFVWKKAYIEVPANAYVLIRFTIVTDNYDRDSVSYSMPSFQTVANDYEPKLEIGNNGMMLYFSARETFSISNEGGSLAVTAENGENGFSVDAEGIKIKFKDVWYKAARETNTGYLKLT